MERRRLNEFVRGDYARVVAVLAYTTGDHHRAEDAVQEAMATALGQRQPIENLSAWIAKTALNQVRMKIRRSGAEQRAYERAELRAVPARSHEPALADDSLGEALRDLPVRQRTVVALHYLLDMAVADVAATMGVSEGTVKTQLHRARESLRVALSPAFEEEADHAG